ncbi:hypothetical protein JCM10450v2_004395 [Rhodotorula kratochvilovae]
MVHFLKLVTALLLAQTASAGPIAYAVCQAGCAGLVVACYTAAGALRAVTADTGTPAAILGCNAAFGSCQAACAAVALAPTP